VTELFLQKRMELYILLIRLLSVMEPSKVLFKQCSQFVPQETRFETAIYLPQTYRIGYATESF